MTLTHTDPYIYDAIDTELGTYEPGGPIPQANSVPTIMAVVDAVANGCSTGTEIAEAIGFSGRQGAYYLDAATSLGLVERIGGSRRLSPLGEDMASVSSPERIERIFVHLSSLSYVQTYLEHGADALEREWSAALSDTTIERRIATIESWADFLTADTDEQWAEDLAVSVATRARAQQIQARRCEAEAKAPKIRRCGCCNMQLPSGRSTCDLCD